MASAAVVLVASAVEVAMKSELFIERKVQALLPADPSVSASCAPVEEAIVIIQNGVEVPTPTSPLVFARMTFPTVEVDAPPLIVTDPPLPPPAPEAPPVMVIAPPLPTEVSEVPPEPAVSEIAPPEALVLVVEAAPPVTVNPPPA